MPLWLLWTKGVFLLNRPYSVSFACAMSLFAEVQAKSLKRKNQRTSKIAAQSCHAALACYRQGMIACPDIVKKWESQGETKVVLRTDSGEASLREISKKAANVGLVAAIVRDAGRTQVPTGTVTAVGIGPGRSGEIAQVTAGLRLL